MDHWQALKDYLIRQIDADAQVHATWLAAEGVTAQTAAFGGLLTANRNTLAKMAELEKTTS